MYLVKSPLRNNGKNYQPGDYIEPEQLNEADIKTLLDLGVIALKSEVKSQKSEVAHKSSDANDPTDKENPDNNEDTSVEETSTARAVRSDFRILTSDFKEVLAFLNSADVKELTKIKGVGNVTAKAIVSHRKTNGLFSSIEELNKLIPNVDWNNVTYDS